MIRSLLSLLNMNSSCKPVALCMLIIVSMLGASSRSAAQAPGVPDSFRIQQNIQKAIKLMNEYKYKESVQYLEEANKIKETSSATYYIGHVHLINNEWAEAVKYAERAVELDPTSVANYSDLFVAYIKSDDVRNWKKGMEIAAKYPALATNQTTAGQVAYLEALTQDAGRSNVFLYLCLAVFAVAIFFPIYKASQKGGAGLVGDPGARFSEALLVSSAVSLILYLLFFAIQPWALAQNPHIPAYEFAVGIRASTFEHDGSESFVMYFLMFAAIFFSVLITPLLMKMRKSANVYVGLMVVLFLMMGYFFFKTGFYPPFPTIDDQHVFLPFLLGLLAFGLYFLYQRSKLAVTIFAVLLSAYCGLIVMAPTSMVDLMYMVAPGLRLYHGAKVPEIYFQYDLMLSYLFYFWMKLKWSLDWFPYVGTVSFFLFFVGSYFFSDRFFKTKGLSAMTLIAIILIRLYVQNYDNPVILQVSPLRLDLWLILLLVANWKGIHHWALGIALGMLIIFHRNLGLIYFGAYIELLIVLFIIDIFDLVQKKELSGATFGSTFMAHLRKNAVNLGIAAVSVGLCFVLFKELFNETAMLYRKLGFGMLPVSVISFYWFVPVLISSIAVLLYYCRRQFGEKYVAVGAFLLLLAIGNSMYFFGRSHENNVLNIAGVLVLTVFMLFDMLIFLAPAGVAAVPQQASAAVGAKDKKGKKDAPQVAVASKSTLLTPRNIALMLPVVFIATTAWFFNRRVTDKMTFQYNNFVESNFNYPIVVPNMDTVSIRQVTDNTDKVYFLEPALDFYFYYFGNYAPQGYYSPSSTFIFKKDMIDFINGLLDKGYCVVYNVTNASVTSEFLPILNYNRTKQVKDIVSLSKVSVPLLLPETPGAVMHAGIKEVSSHDGIDYTVNGIKDAASFEYIIRPMGAQGQSAVVANNLTQYAFEGLRGFTLQSSGTVAGQYLFGFSNGSNTVPFANFNMSDGAWHYVVATVDKDMLKVYVDGNLAGSVASGGTPILNSEMAMTIGNRSSRDSKFNGDIREVKITNGVLDAAQVQANAQKVASQLAGM